MAGEQSVRIGGRRLRVTNLEKVLYPETGTTKAEVIDLERWRDRPIWKKWAEAVLDPFEDWL